MYLFKVILIVAVLSIFTGCNSTQGSARYSAPSVHISGDTVTIYQSPIVRDTVVSAPKDYDLSNALAADTHVGSPHGGNSGGNATATQPEKVDSKESENVVVVEETTTVLPAKTGNEE